MKVPALDYIFHPRSIVVAGVSDDPHNAGQWFLKALDDFPFEGPLYAVNPKGGELGGHKIYPSIKDVPGPVDYVVACIPARVAVEFMMDCVSKQAKVVHFFTSGFKEMNAEGARSEAELIKVATQGGVRIIGPNCMGLYCPESRLSFSSSFPKESGNVAFVSQSGGNTILFVQLGASRGLRFSKAISYGNASDLNETDFLEYCADDAATKIIGAYIEGVKDGRRFFRVLKETARKKPTIILKGGRTHAGTRAVASHTGSLMGSELVWGSVFKQTQAIRVNNLGELADVILAIQSFPDLRGRRVGVIGLGGGASVQAADEIEMAGLYVPALPEDVQEQLKRFTFFSSGAGSTYNNPVDSPLVAANPEIFSHMLNIIGACPEIDLVMGYMGVDTPASATDLQEPLLVMGDTLIGFGKSHLKPTVIVTAPSFAEVYGDTVSIIRRKALDNGLPFYPSLNRAAKAIYKATEYREKKEQE
jgi:acyl-CoA synthetase (NDP forming)